MLLDPIHLDEGNLGAVFMLSSADDAKALGNAFAAVLLTVKPDSCVGFVAPACTGKTTLVSGIYTGLGLNYGSIDDMMVGVNGLNTAHTEKGFLVRHYDMAVSPEDEDHLDIPSHWSAFNNRAERQALHLVEHATKCRGNSFDFVFRLKKQTDMERSAEFYCADPYKNHEAVQNFLCDYAGLIPSREIA